MLLVANRVFEDNDLLAWTLLLAAMPLVVSHLRDVFSSLLSL